MIDEEQQSAGRGETDPNGKVLTSLRAKGNLTEVTDALNNVTSCLA
jgi:hypothetical protein